MGKCGRGKEGTSEVIFIFLAFGIFNNRLDTRHLTLYDHDNLCGGECPLTEKTQNAAGNRVKHDCDVCDQHIV